ncbi:MAG: metallophosphoesterase [Eubacterium sp.]|nr:metallophosphoesterase [Eubacterium sp.]MDD7210443.1 metallophosphoesterase [Lachnospiraceae bacterium]MDY5496627.1 metallophosphoesterase [Anaerobutyricum sp.]
MRILVISDSHGRNDDVEGVIEQVGKIDMLIHCGDVERGDDYIRSLVDCPVHLVAGNNDYNLDLPSQDIFHIGDYKVWVVHGHMYHVYRGVERLRKKALEDGIDIVMFGHTHKPYIEIGEDLTILNPGSLSYPRQADRRPTFLIMEIDEEGEAHFGHGYYRSKFSELKI